MAEMERRIPTPFDDRDNKSSMAARRAAFSSVAGGARDEPANFSPVKITKELIELRQDINIVAQHIVAIRKEINDKLQTLVDTSDNFEAVTKKVLEQVILKISDGELDTFSEALNQIIQSDSESNRKKLFEDIERAIIANTPKPKSAGISLGQWLINILLVAGIAGVFFLLKG